MTSGVQTRWYPYGFIHLVCSHDDIGIIAIGIITNATMALAKGLGGWLFSSQTLMADGLHSLTDLLEDFLTLYAVFWSAKSRASQSSLDINMARLGTGGVGAMLLAGGVTQSFRCISKLVRLSHPVDNIGSFEQDFGAMRTQSSLNVNAVWIAMASIVVKEWLYRISMLNSRLCGTR